MPSRAEEPAEKPSRKGPRKAIPARPDVKGFQVWLRAKLVESVRSARSISQLLPGRHADYLGQFLVSNPETARSMPSPQEMRVIVREIGGNGAVLLDALRFWGVDPDELEADLAILAARRDDQYSFKRLPPQALDEIRAFIAFTKAKYLQRLAEDEGTPDPTAGWEAHG